MQKNKNNRSQHLIYFCCAAFLASLSIVLGKYLAFNLGDSIRISFENLPIIFAGLFFGPAIGGAVGLTADLLGCILVGYTINPIITLGACSIGILSGIVSKKHSVKLNRTVIFSVAFSHLFGSVLIKTFGLSLYYSMPFVITMLWRLLTYSMIATAESVILIFLTKNIGLINEIEKITGKKIL